MHALVFKCNPPLNYSYDISIIHTRVDGFFGFYVKTKKPGFYGFYGFYNTNKYKL